ncbi:MAG: TonB-dependent receptor [Saprospiraceae bacterium]|nr:TonB-dependent receptor [Saprospiraceae bacterium]
MKTRFYPKLLALAVLFALLGYAPLWGQTKVNGKVTSTDNEPLIGVSIVVKNTSTGTATDVDGTYSLDVAPGTVLQFSYTGFATQDVVVGNSTQINVVMQLDLALLDEVVVIGYGQVKRSNVVGAITSVKAEELQKVPSTNVMESLQGKLPGVDITRTSGAAGAGINVLVRGNRSLTASNSPLFIVDGIQYNSIQDLNPQDIQSMEVLKDAASTAIYGSRGANGVILVTTKKGVAGTTRVSFNSYTGVSELFGYPQVQTPEEYRQFRREANRTTGNWSGPQDDAAIFGNLLNSPGAIWPDLFINNGSQQDYQLGISTGTEKTNFYVSLNYFNEKGLFVNDQLNRYAMRVNVDHTISRMFKVGTQNQVTFYDQDIRQDPLNTANKLVPLEVPYDDDGNIIPWLNNNRTINPLLDEQPGNWLNNNRTSRVFTSGYVEFKPFEDLTFRSNLGVTLTSSRDGLYAGSLTVLRAGTPPLARFTTGNSFGYNLENILMYNKQLGLHAFTVTAVQSVLSNRREDVTAQGANQLLAYQGFYGLANANEQVSVSSAFVESALLSYTARIQYGFNDKYLLMATARTDGASQLSAGNKWAFFPSVGAAWRISQEDFLAGSNLISDLKLRLSYGVAGNSAVLPYATQSNLIRVPFAFDETPAIGYAFGNNLGNNDLSWEISKTSNAGLDFGLWKGRVNGTIDYFQTNTEDLLLERLVPLSTGFARVTENVGKTETKGIEVGVNAFLINRKGIDWNVGVNWFKVDEKIVELATGGNDVANGWFIGYPTQSFYDFEKIGIWQLNEADQAAGFGQAPGDIRVRDQNGDGTINAATDRVILGTTRPKWNANFNTDLRVKGFDVSLQFFVRWGQMMSYDFVSIYDPQANENSLSHDYWTPENATNDFPRPSANRSRAATLYYSTLFYQDASFAKLRAATIGYSLPKSLLTKLHLSKFRIYATGRNLLVLSKVKDYDPERGGSMTNPMNRLFVGGINVEF